MRLYTFVCVCVYTRHAHVYLCTFVNQAYSQCESKLIQNPERRTDIRRAVVAHARWSLHMCVRSMCSWLHRDAYVCDKRRTVTSVMPEALSTEGGRVKRSTQGKRSFSCKAWVTTGSGSQRRVQRHVHPPPPTHRDKHLVISFIVISVTVVHNSVTVTVRENKVITPTHTHTVAGRGAFAPLTSVF